MRLFIRFLLIFLLLFMAACASNSLMLKNRNLLTLEVGEKTNVMSSLFSSHLLENKQEILSLQNGITEILKKRGFDLWTADSAWGGLPLIGDTREVSYKVAGKSYMYCLVVISKTDIKVSFSDMENSPGSGVFQTTDKDRSLIHVAAINVKNYIQAKLPEKNIRIMGGDGIRL